MEVPHKQHNLQKAKYSNFGCEINAKLMQRREPQYYWPFPILLKKSQLTHDLQFVGAGRCQSMAQAHRLTGPLTSSISFLAERARPTC
jgi:hypothetical protein